MRFVPLVALLSLSWFSVGCITIQTESSQFTTMRQIDPVETRSRAVGDSTNCQHCQSEYCGGGRFMRCLYGEMVSDGNGGTYRRYGYPRFGCRDEQCCQPTSY